MWRGSRKAVSAVLGTAIALAIFFTVIIPALLYIQSLQSLFMQEVSRRLQYELERIHEKLNVRLSLALRPGEGYVIFLIIENTGTLSVNVPTVYLESTGRGLMTFSSEEVLGKSFFAPGELFERGTGQYFRSDDEVIRAKVVTLRGNGFTSESIGPRKLPYLLLVSLENMISGTIYTIVVSRSGTEYGCVLAGVASNNPCGDIARYNLTALTPGESRVAVFMVAPGKYRIELFKDNAPSGIPSQEVEVFQDTVLRITLPKPSLPAKAPLRIDSALSDSTTVVLQQQSGSIYIPYMISLGNNSEPLRNIRIEISILTCSGLSSCSITKSVNIVSRLTPGEPYFGAFTVRITDDTANDYKKFGGLIKYKISMVEATGELTQKKYSSSDMDFAEIQRSIFVCRLNATNYALICKPA